MSLFDITEIIGIIAFALSGFMVGVRKKLDVLGVFIVAFLTALGGGLTRDMMVGHMPYSIKNPIPVLVVSATFFVACILRLYKKTTLDQHTVFVVADSIGLVSFSISGALIGLKTDINFFGVVILSFLTAVGGGIIRDVLVNDVPAILRSDFYGSVAVVIALIMLGLNKIGFINGYVIAAVFILGLFLRLFAYFRKWELPNFE